MTLPQQQQQQQIEGGGVGERRPSWSDESACPVPHAKSQPLPPGHPPVPDATPSTLFPPTGPRCVFYRSPEDLGQTPPLSRSSSFISSSTAASLPSLHELAVTHSAAAADFDRLQKLDQARKEANINPLPTDKDGQMGLDPATTLVLASRNSQLALVQSSHVSAMLEARYGRSSPVFVNDEHQVEALTGNNGIASSSKLTVEHTDSDAQDVRTTLEALHTSPSAPLRPYTFPITSMSTAGDQNLRSPLYVIGGEGKAIWTGELEVALRQGGVDAIVHSLKDVPTVLPKGFEVAAILEREDPRDALVVKQGLPYRTLDELPAGSVIGTSSIRRVAQLRRRYPHLVFSDVRGNLNTRLAKLDAPTGPYTALVLAAAGLVRINLHHRITAFLSSPVLLYSVGQGSLAVEVRTPPKGADPATNRDARVRELIRSIGDWRATFRAEAERSLLRELEGGCSIPVGVESRFEDHDQVEGKRNEAVGLVDHAVLGEDVEAKADGLPNGGVPLCREGHTIPVNQLVGIGSNDGGAAEAVAPPPLQRLDTGAEQQRLAQAREKAGAAAAQCTLAEKIASSTMSIANRSVPPPEGRVLLLDAIVVSLDGSRSSRYSESALCKTVEDARTLGIRVAHELAEKRGARSILQEVERHRKMAEEADQKRRDEAKKRKAQGLPGGEARPAPVAVVAGGGGVGGAGGAAETGDLNALRNAKEGWMRGHTHIDLADEVDRIRNGAVAVQAQTEAKQAYDPLEIDRRFVPRDDGQPKAWEV
ncbi:porphobilinogen deaminase [Thecaphora frezii]